MVAKKCTVIFLILFPFLNFWQTNAAEITPFTDDLLNERTIYIIDPVTNKVLTSIISSDYQLISNIEGFINEVEDLVHSLAHGSESEPGYNKPMILDRLDENGEIIKGRPKISINEQLLVEKIIEASFSGGKIELPLHYTESDYMEVDIPYLNQVVLASYTTIFNSSNTGRSKNIELSAIAINNVIVGNGDIFSFNSVVGPRDVATGYQKAPEIVKGKLVMGIGGGICQTSSTLFNTVDLLKVESIERHHHSRDVGYVPKGRDATVSFGGLDYRFQNTTGIPFIIKTIYRKGSITVQIRTSQEYANILRNELSLKKKGEPLSFFLCFNRIFWANMEYIHYDL